MGKEILTSLNTHQYLEPQAQVVNRMKKGKLASKAVLENKFWGKKKVEQHSRHILCINSRFHYWTCSAFHFSVNGIKHMVYLQWHLAQKFNILADSGLENSLSQTGGIPPRPYRYQETSYIEHTKTLGYTPAFKYENILSSSSLFPSSQVS